MHWFDSSAWARWEVLAFKRFDFLHFDLVHAQSIENIKFKFEVMLYFGAQNPTIEFFLVKLVLDEGST